MGFRIGAYGRCLELTPDLVRYLETEPDPGKNDNNGPKRHIITALKRMKDTRAIPVLVNMLGSENSQIRRTAARTLEEMAGNRHVPELAGGIATAKAPNGRELGRSGDVDAAQRRLLSMMCRN